MFSLQSGLFMFISVWHSNCFSWHKCPDQSAIKTAVHFWRVVGVYELFTRAKWFQRAVDLNFTQSLTCNRRVWKSKLMSVMELYLSFCFLLSFTLCVLILIYLMLLSAGRHAESHSVEQKNIYLTFKNSWYLKAYIIAANLSFTFSKCPGVR